MLSIVNRITGVASFVGEPSCKSAAEVSSVSVPFKERGELPTYFAGSASEKTGHTEPNGLTVERFARSQLHSTPSLRRFETAWDSGKR